jgi:amino acid transporter
MNFIGDGLAAWARFVEVIRVVFRVPIHIFKFSLSVNGSASDLIISSLPLDVQASVRRVIEFPWNYKTPHLATKREADNISPPGRPRFMPGKKVNELEKLSYARPGISPAIKRATLLPLIGITYCMVAGGPYGLEDLVHQAGYRRAVLLLLIAPLLWSFPVTLMVSELSAAMPEDGGYYVWVRRAMGPFWGFQEAWLSLAASIFDMAIYPSLFITYLARLWPAAGEGHLSTFIGIGLIAVCVGMNLAGIRLVGAGSLVMTIALLLPFAVMVALALSQHQQAAVATTAAAPMKVSWLGGILVVMWNYMGWDNASTIAGEVERPQRTYPLAMLLSVLLVAATYVIPVAAAARSGIAPVNWATGSWVNAGRTVGGGISPVVGTVLAVGITAAG